MRDPCATSPYVSLRHSSCTLPMHCTARMYVCMYSCVYMYVCGCVHVCMSGWPRLRRGALIADSSTYVSLYYSSCTLPMSRTACKYVHIYAYVYVNERSRSPPLLVTAKLTFLLVTAKTYIFSSRAVTNKGDVHLFVTAKLTFCLATAFACCRRVASSFFCSIIFLGAPPLSHPRYDRVHNRAYIQKKYDQAFDRC